MTRQFQIAQVNIARMRAPLDDPLLAGFVARLKDINALAARAFSFANLFPAPDSTLDGPVVQTRCPAA